jgi:thioredoxin 1
VGKLIDLQESDFDARVLQASGLVVVDFGATWCAPCKKLHPILEEVMDDFDNTFPIYEVDVGDSPGIARRYGVISVPQTHFFKDGERVDTIIGLVKKQKIVDIVKKHI